MDKPIYLVSLYYRADVQSGANKRFECLLHALESRPDVQVAAVIPESEVHGLDRIDARVIPVPVSRVSGLNRFVGWFKLARTLRSLSPGIVVSDLMPPVLDAAGHTVYQLVHDVRALDGFRVNSQRSRLAALQYLVMLRRTRRVITVSRASAERIGLAHRTADVSVVPNGLSNEYFQAINHGPRRFDVLCIGIFETRKNYERAILTINELVKSGSPLRCLFIGSDGGDKVRILELIDKLELADNVTVGQQIPDEGQFVAATYDQARVYFNPSLYEGFGMPLIEAAARGCNVVCSTIAPFKELDLPGARYCDPLSVESMHGALSAALCAEAEYDYAFRDRYSWDAIAEILLRAVDDG